MVPRAFHVTFALLATLALPGDAYHMDGAPSAALPGASDTDFLLPFGAVPVCETTGPGDAINPSHPAALANSSFPGIGGLCYAGRNGGSGTVPPIGPPSKSLPYTRLDVCTASTAQRGWPAVQPCSAAVPPGTRDAWAFTAQLGVYSCTLRPALAFYYDETFAWLTWGTLAPGGNGHVRILVESWQGTNVNALLAASPTNPNAWVMGSVEATGLLYLPTQTFGCGGAPTGLGPVWSGV